MGCTVSKGLARPIYVNYNGSIDLKQPENIDTKPHHRSASHPNFFHKNSAVIKQEPETPPRESQADYGHDSNKDNHRLSRKEMTAENPATGGSSSSKTTYVSVKAPDVHNPSAGFSAVSRPQTAPSGPRTPVTDTEAEIHYPAPIDAWEEKPKAEGTSDSREAENVASSLYETESDDGDLANMKKQLEEKEMAIKAMQAGLAQQQSKFEDEMKQKEETIKRLEDRQRRQKEEIDSLSKRLSKEMVWKVTSSDETSLENVNMKIRPMTLADEYRMICSDSWLRANENLEENFGIYADDENKKYNLLCQIILIAERSCKIAKDMVLDMLSQAVQNPLLVFKECLEPKESKHGKESKNVKLKKFEYPHSDKHERLPASAEREILYSLRLNADQAGKKYLIKFVFDKVVERYPELKREKQIKGYTEELTHLCWKMITQQPPMAFDTSQKGKPWSKKDHAKLEPYFGSDIKSPDAKIAYYVFPSLVHGDQTMVQGKIMVQNVGAVDL